MEINFAQKLALNQLKKFLIDKKLKGVYSYLDSAGEIQFEFLDEEQIIIKKIEYKNLLINQKNG